MKKKCILWISGGVTSAVACKIASEKYRIENCVAIWIDTKNEHEDTVRFVSELEAWIGVTILKRTNEKFDSIDQVWRKYNSLNVATGAICSTHLKRKIRISVEKEIPYFSQVFGFDATETKRAKGMSMNNPNSLPEYPLIENGITKKDCFRILKKAGIEPPEMYKLGYQNNNCFGTGCVQGGIGYWQKIKKEFPEKFQAMGELEHELTKKKEAPVTMLVDRVGGEKKPLFLLPNSDYPEIKDISTSKGREPKPLLECNGFCGTNDLNPSAVQYEINWEDS